MRHALHLLGLAALASSLTHQSPPSTGSSPGDTIAYTTANVRVREKPLANAKELAFIATGTSLRLKECSEGWCLVSIKSVTGYALQE